MLLSAAAIVAGILAVSACAGHGDSEPREARTARPAPAAAAAPTLVVRTWDAGGEHLVLVDTARNRARTPRLPQVAPGDPPYNVVATAGRVVFYGVDGAYVLDPAAPRRPRRLGPAWYFVPSATPGRVWLTTLDPESPDTVRSLSGVREVTLTGRTTATGGAPPCRGPTTTAATRGALICQARGRPGLVVWDPQTGAVIRRLRGPFPVATRGSLVAWLTLHPSAVHLTDVRTGRDRRVPPGPGFRFESTYAGAFSPDGRRLALPVRAADARHAIAVVDVARLRARMVAGTPARPGWVAIAWAPDGDLYFATPTGRIARLRDGADRARTLPVRVAGTVVDMAIP